MLRSRLLLPTLVALVLLAALARVAPCGEPERMFVNGGAPPLEPAGLVPDGDWRPREPRNGAELRLALRRLRVLGSVLYVGAHPDDENTAMLASWSQGRLVRTAYLSLTRGDGGQNLIGDQIGEALGVIRTHELLAARHVDGAEQYFSRALDFGFSKNPQETLEFWGKDSILSDVVWVIRGFRPDVMVLRFPTDGRGGHGHHTASAILAEEAFAAAGDPARFPEQLRYVKPWRPKRLLWNVFGRDTSTATGHAPPLRVDLGAYQPVLGRSFSEIAGESRSMHKSQGFGAPERRGSRIDFLEQRLGDPVKADVFEDIDLGWSRVKGGAEVDRALAEAERAFDPERPQAAIPALLRAHAALSKLGGEPWVAIKRGELREAIRSCAGLWMEALAMKPEAAAGGEVRIATAVIQRAPADLVLEHVVFPYGFSSPRVRAPQLNVALADTALVRIPSDAPISQPSWLRRPRGRGRFDLDPPQVGHAIDAPALSVRMVFRAGGESLPFDVPVVYRWTDPVRGDRYRPFTVVPPVTMDFDQKFYVFPSGSTNRAVRLRIESPDVPVSGRVSLKAPNGFTVSGSQEVKLAGQGDQAFVEFHVANMVPVASPAGVFRAEFQGDHGRWSSAHNVIDHPHIPLTDLYPPAEARYVATDIKRRGDRVGYVMGSGDEGPAALRQMGWDVTLLTDDDLQWGDLARFHTIVTGVRAWNTRDVLKRVARSRLVPWVFAGHTLLVQYNTAEPGLGEGMGFGRFTIGRDRVTVEEAQVRMREDDPLMTTPNRIRPADFEGWVQERGLYYATAWDSTVFHSVLSSNDPGEPPRDGGLLARRLGEGWMIYTGYSFFRQIPAGVPGAFRVFANLVSMEDLRIRKSAASPAGGSRKGAVADRPSSGRRAPRP
jgi:LmbE family N-acetylglucosaminyl deacetylase